ncbi:hypothetical protein G9A89_016201 [Geosiphon pyriformis]|nr:hypothetical protein G9A89_016201 [Geosiphon pyriformis]
MSSINHNTPGTSSQINGSATNSKSTQVVTVTSNLRENSKTSKESSLDLQTANEPSTIDDFIKEPLMEAEIQKNRVIICVGVPGSGKSTFSKALCKEFPNWYRINQDDLGSRKLCEAKFRDQMRQNKNVIIDRCNFDEAQRKTWVQIAWNYNVPVDVIIMDTSYEECAARINVRQNHPTDVQGIEGIKILEKFKDWMKEPRIEEGFERITKVKPQPNEIYTKEAIEKIFIQLNDEIPVIHNRNNKAKNRDRGGSSKKSHDSKKTQFSSKNLSGISNLDQQQPTIQITPINETSNLNYEKEFPSL